MMPSWIEQGLEQNAPGFIKPEQLPQKLSLSEYSSTMNTESLPQHISLSDTTATKDMEALPNKYKLDPIQSDDVIRQIENGETKKLSCRNQELEGNVHPITGVPFERRTIEIDGKSLEVVVPKFNSEFDITLPDSLFKATDAEQFKYCNEKLYDSVKCNADLRVKFDEEQLEQIENGDTPDGFTWHHDADSGKMQLVDTETHQKTGHTGGRSIWGGGTEAR